MSTAYALVTPSPLYGLLENSYFLFQHAFLQKCSFLNIPQSLVNICQHLLRFVRAFEHPLVISQLSAYLGTGLGPGSGPWVLAGPVPAHLGSPGGPWGTSTKHLYVQSERERDKERERSSAYNLLCIKNTVLVRNM